MASIISAVSACQKAPTETFPREADVVISTRPTHAPGTSHAKAPNHRFVSVAELRAILKRPQHPVVIDVRARKLFRAWHIPRSIHRPAWHLKSSSVVRVGDPIIVHDGLGSAPLAGVLRELADDGHPVRVLKGGMAAWCREGGETTAPCIDADVIHASDALQAMDCANRRLILALDHTTDQPPPSLELPGRLGTATVLGWTTREELAPRVQEASEGAQQILMVDRDGTRIAELRSSLSGLTPPVFYVRGGLAELTTHATSMRPTKTGQRLLSKGIGPNAGPPRGFTTAQGDCGCL